MQLTPALCTDRMITNLNRQIECYGIIAALSKRQLKCIDRNNTLGLEAIVKKRQAQIERIEILAKEIAGYRKYMQETWHLWPAALANELSKSDSTLKRVLASVVRLDEQLSEAIRGKMAEFKDELGKLRCRQRLNSKYAAPKDSRVPRYADKKG